MSGGEWIELALILHRDGLEDVRLESDDPHLVRQVAVPLLTEALGILEKMREKYPEYYAIRSAQILDFVRALIITGIW